MGMMDDAIRETVKDTFTKTDLEKKARMATNKQIGGSHYKDCKIQPIDYIMQNNLSTSHLYICHDTQGGNLTKVEEKHGQKL